MQSERWSPLVAGSAAAVPYLSSLSLQAGMLWASAADSCSPGHTDKTHPIWGQKRVRTGSKSSYPAGVDGDGDDGGRVEASAFG